MSFAQESAASACPVAVLGAAAVDWVARVPAMPPLDGIVLADSFARYPGGAAANVAMGVARLGWGTRFFGTVGADPEGAWLRDSLAQAGVSVDALRPVAGQRSAACFIAIDAQGRRMIFALGGEALISRPEQLDRTQFDGTRLAWIGDAFPEVALAVAGATRAQGGQVFFGPGGVMAACGLDGLAPILAASDVLVVSRGEAESLTGQADPSQAAERLRAALAAPGVVVITLGEAGAVVLSGAELARVAAFPVERVVDTTGAGDAFAAGLIAARLEGRAWEEAARMGCAAAAHKIAYTGARSGQPTRAEISEIMRKGYDR